MMVVLGLHRALFYAAWSNLSHINKFPTIPPLVTKSLPTPTSKRFRPVDAVDCTKVHSPVVDEPPVVKIAEELTVLAGDELPLTAGSVREFEPGAEPDHAVVRMTGAPAGGFPNVDDFLSSDVHAHERARNNGGTGVRQSAGATRRGTLGRAVVGLGHSRCCGASSWQKPASAITGQAPKTGTQWPRALLTQCVSKSGTCASLGTRR